MSGTGGERTRADTTSAEDRGATSAEDRGATSAEDRGATSAEDRDAQDRRRTGGPEGGRALRPIEWLRWLWNNLTSMRTALVLLFILALAAIPGALIPQRPQFPFEVQSFIAENPTLGKVYDAIGFFDVYASPWFSAIYLLLFVSLLGCIVPRILVYARALRSAPPRTPRNLRRLPVWASWTAGDGNADGDGGDPTEEELLGRAEEVLRKRRFRTVRHDGSVSAERGYLREAGNLVFHCSLVVVLIALAIGALWGYRGNVVVVVGNGFSNTITQYDDFTAGGWFDSDRLTPFSFTVDDFRAQFETGPVQRGAARLFEADLTVTDAPGAAPRKYHMEVNSPLEIAGTQVHLSGHGYAPRVTVRDGNGDVAFAGPVPFLPQDGNFTSAGAIKAPDGRPDRLAFQGFFLPTAVVDEAGPRSVFPDAFNPELFLNAYWGPPRVETGAPENVYSLDVTGLMKFTAKNAQGEEDTLRLRLVPGQTVQLPDGKGSITFEGYDRWVKLQVSRTPALGLALGGVAAAVFGLCLSLFVRPRRIWVKVRRTGSGLQVEVAGLDRADARVGLDEEVDAVAGALMGENADGHEIGLRRSTDGSETAGSPTADRVPRTERTEDV